MASRSLNKVMLIGNLGRDAETRYTPSGTAVTNFSVATTYRYREQQSGEWKENTEWHDIVLWRGENVAPYLLKGKQVFVEGRLQTRSWEDQNGNKRYKTEVVSENLMLLGGRGDGPDAPTDNRSEDVSQERPAQRSSSPAPARQEDPGPEGITDDDVPF